MSLLLFGLKFSWFLFAGGCYLLVGCVACFRYFGYWFVLVVCFYFICCGLLLTDLVCDYALLICFALALVCCYWLLVYRFYLFVIWSLCYFAVDSFVRVVNRPLYVCVVDLSWIIVILFDLLVVGEFAWLELLFITLLCCWFGLVCLWCLMYVVYCIGLYDFNSNFAFHYYEFENY